MVSAQGGGRWRVVISACESSAAVICFGVDCFGNVFMFVFNDDRITFPVNRTDLKHSLMILYFRFDGYI